MCVWSDVMIHKFILSVSGLSDFSSTAGFCLRSSFQSYDTSAFNFDWLLSLHHSSILIITLCPVLFSSSLKYSIVVQQIDLFFCSYFLCDSWSCRKACVLTILTKWLKPQTAGVWWTLFVDISLTFWRSDDILTYHLQCSKFKKNQSLFHEGFVSFFFSQKKAWKTNIEHAHTALILKNDTMSAIQSIWWAYHQYVELCGQMSIKLMQNRIHSSKLAWG